MRRAAFLSEPIYVSSSQAARGIGLRAIWFHHKSMLWSSGKTTVNRLFCINAPIEPQRMCALQTEKNTSSVDIFVDYK